MTHAELIALLGGWEEYVISEIERQDDDTSPQLWITLVPDGNQPAICSECEQQCSAIHDVTKRWIRDLPVFDADCWKDWYRRAISSQIEPLKKFACNLKEFILGIVSHCRWPLHTSVLEGINNKIKVHKTHSRRLPRWRVLLPQSQTGIPRYLMKNRTSSLLSDNRVAAQLEPVVGFSGCAGFPHAEIRRSPISNGW